jgi:NAD(P)-dependent dehydrogenase (short-subunit alcohol dehydrogenase family)
LDQAADAKVAKNALEARQPMGRLVSPSEIANAIVFLASPKQAAVTGTSLNIDGGLHSLRIPKS